LFFQGPLATSAPVNVGAPQGSRLSLLLFLLYLASLHLSVPRGLMISYMDDFALTVASLSYSGNVHQLQKLFNRLETKAARLGIPFSVPKTELIHGSTPTQRNSAKCLAPIQIKAELLDPQEAIQWLGYRFTPALDTATHFSRRLALTQIAFTLIRCLSPPGAGLAPYVCHRLANSVIAPILLYGADIFTPDVRMKAQLNSFWNKVQRGTMNCFSATPIAILSRESCLPPVSLLVYQRKTLAALRPASSPPSMNPATARVLPSFLFLSAHRASDSSKALTRGLKSIYLPLNWRTPRPTPPIRKHHPIDEVAHRTVPFTKDLSRMPMINSHLVPTAMALPTQSLMNNTYATLKKRLRESLLDEWPKRFPTPGYYHHPPALNPWPFMRLGKLMAGRIHLMRASKGYVAAPHRGRQMLTPPAPAAAGSPQPSCPPSSPAPLERVPEHASSTA